LSGEHLETVVFAALQVANGKEIRNPNTLSDFILELVKLLSPDVVREYGKEIQGPILQALELHEIKILNFTHKESFHARKISMLEERDLKMVNDDIAAAAAAKEAKAEREEARKRKAEEAITPQTTKKTKNGKQFEIFYRIRNSISTIDRVARSSSYRYRNRKRNIHQESS